MEELNWIIVKNPNMREEKYLTGLGPIEFDYEESDAMKFSIKEVIRISAILLSMGISHELRQTY